MLSTYDTTDAFTLRFAKGDRAALPLLGFVLGAGVSLAAWLALGSIAWLVLW